MIYYNKYYYDIQTVLIVNIKITITINVIINLFLFIITIYNYLIHFMLLNDLLVECLSIYQVCNNVKIRLDSFEIRMNLHFIMSSGFNLSTNLRRIK